MDNIDKTLEQIAEASYKNPGYKLTEEQIDVIANDVKERFFPTRTAIIDAARRDGEKPYGAIITRVRDYYGIPKSKGGVIVDRILSDYNIDNEMPIR